MPEGPIGIMAAMPEELSAVLELFESRGDEIIHGRRVFHSGCIGGRAVVAVFSRCGKVAAAATATELIVRFEVRSIVFTGLAGGVGDGVGIGDLVVPEELVQHDLDARPLFPRFEVPLSGVGRWPTDERLRDRLRSVSERFLRERGRGRVHGGLLATGDRFIASASDRHAVREALPGVVAVDMEAAAVGQVAADYGVPLGVVRLISDAADDSAGSSFEGALSAQAGRCADWVFRLFFASS